MINNFKIIAAGLLAVCLIFSAGNVSVAADNGKLVFQPEGHDGIKSLKLGMYGERVEQLQRRLLEKGFLAEAADGYFGKSTEAAVQLFQREQGLYADGIVGQATLEALEKGESAPAEGVAQTTNPNVLKMGMSGDNVNYLQGMLTNAGYLAGGIDGSFGSGTKDAVLRFQRDYGLTADGVVGPATLEALREAVPETSRSMRQLTMQATAYSAFDLGNGQYTHNGSFLCKGIVAVDPNVIPLGTRLYIPDYGYAIADDTGSAIKGSRIDLAFNTNAEALSFGVKQVTVYIID